MLRLPQNALQVSRIRHPCREQDGLQLLKTDATTDGPDQRTEVIVDTKRR